MNTRIIFVILALVAGLIVLGQAALGQTQAQGADPPQPLPHDCPGVTPLTPTPACCAYGYVYYNGVPIAGAAVTIRSSHGERAITTGAGQASAFPYYGADLASAPLSVQAGETITVTARYAGRTGMTVHQVGAAGQQVDVIMLVSGVDLTIQSIAVAPPDPALPAAVAITMTILNQGDQAATGFRTYLYVDPADQPPSATTADTSWTSIFGLGAAASYQWAVTDIELGPGCHTIWAWVDRDDAVAEADETNNLSHMTIGPCATPTPTPTSTDTPTPTPTPTPTETPTLTPTPTWTPACQPDAYETDNLCSQAHDITTDGIHQLRNLCPAGDADWVKFPATAGITYTIEASNVGADARMILSLYDRCDGAPAFGSGARIVWAPPASGTYWVKAEHHAPQYGPDAAYDLSVTASTDCPGDIYEPDDSCNAARDLPTDGARQTRLFCRAGDPDWVKFQASSGATYFIVADNVGPDASPMLSLYNACAAPGSWGSGQQIRWIAPTDGLYYVKAENHNPQNYGHTARYDLRVEMTACAADSYEPDNDIAHANTIEVDGAAQRHQFCPAGDEDWVRFTATASLNYTLATANLGGASDTVLCLFGNDGAPIACDDDGGGGRASRLTWLAPADGVYYAQARHYDPTASGPDTGYDLTVARQACAEDAYEQDDQPTDARPITTDGVKQPHNTCPAGDEDWVKFDVTGAAGQYIIETADLGPSADTVLFLYDTDATTELASNDDYDAGEASRIVWRFPAAGTYYAKVRHFAPEPYGAGTAYNLAVTFQAGGTSTPTPTPTSTPTPTATPPPPSRVETLILTNRARVAALYGDQSATDLLGRLEALAGYPAAPGAVIQVEANAAVAAAYAPWVADPLDTTRANNVAAAIRNLILQYLADNPDVKYIVIAGDDRVIPYRRTLDRTNYPESEYTSSASAGTTLWAACRDDMSLTDDYYADRAPTLWQGHELYIPDYAIARLVETPAEIMAQIDAFLANDTVVANKALATGYDFVIDAGQEMANTLRTDLGSANTDDALIGSSWSCNDLRARQLNTAPRFDVQAINGHANHRAEGCAQGGVILADEIATGTADLTGAVIYTVGCHSGFNDLGNDAVGQRGLDLTQAFARRKVNYIANTGFGWGYRFGVGLSERLMADLTLELLRGDAARIGPALRDAKQRYYAETNGFTDHDEKILIEATLYGVPMYRLTTGSTLGDKPPFPSAIVTNTVPATFGELRQGRVEVGLVGSFSALVETTTADGAYFALDGRTQMAAGAPIQPLFFADMTASTAGALHGALLRSATYSDRPNFTPLIARPMNEYTTTVRTAFTSTGWHPPVPFAATGAGGPENLVALLGQYRAETRTERLYDRLAFDLFYSASPDRLPPTISLVSAAAMGGAARVKVAVADPAGIHRVVVAYTAGGGAWASVDLVYDGIMRKWVGAIPAGVAWFVQAVDGAGNVAVADNKGRYFTTRGGDMRRVYLPTVLKMYSR